MKALILSAGFGTRLRPHTERIPKPLFPIGGRPLIDILIGQLVCAGATAIAVNTHHLSDQIIAFLNRQDYPVPVVTRFEPEILGTGGAIKNFSDILNDAPFMVINSDVLTDIDLRRIYAAHLARAFPVTLVLHDHQQFNTVSIDSAGFITGFSGRKRPDDAVLAFTGIQVVDPVIFRYIPDSGFVSSIDTYRQLIREGEKVRAEIVRGHYWNDLGIAERYRDAVIDHMAPAVFKTAACDRPPGNPFQKELLAGDGSDRMWYRITCNGRTRVLADHGIRTDPDIGEIDAYVAIGNHLRQNRIPVPQIHAHDRFSGLVFLEDLGDILLQDVIASETDPARIIAHYKPVIEALVRMGISGADGFDTAWAYQGDRYDRQLIIDKEGGYFITAFVNGYLEHDAVSPADLESEFGHLSDRILETAVIGLMHRDMQSRNIMLKDGRYCFIDFQGARFGPVQYDLAALLYDPYVDLADSVRENLLQMAVDAYAGCTTIDPQRFVTGFTYCAVSRLLQALGAFGHLTRVKHKPQFERYIPVALATLRHILAQLDDPHLSQLGAVVATATDRFNSRTTEPGLYLKKNDLK